MATQQKTPDGARPQTPLQDMLAQAVRRLRLAHWTRLAARGALAATCLALLCVGLAHVGLLPPWLPLGVTIPVLLLCGIGLGTLFAAASPVDSFSAAREIEVRLGLKERLSSALEFDLGPATADPEAALLRRLQQEDAVAHVRALRSADAIPLRFPWEAKALIPVFVVLLLALVLPALPVFVPPGVRAERAVVQKSGEMLTRAARVVEKRADAQGLPGTKEAARDVQHLGEKMAQGHMDKKEAMVQMARLSRQMADEQKRLADEQKRLAQAGAGPGQAGAGPGQADKGLAQAGRQSAQSLPQPASASGSDPATPSAGKGSGKDATVSAGSPDMRKAAQALRQNDASALGGQLRALAQRVGERAASPSEQQRAAQDLQKLSEALKGTPLSEAQKHVQSAADAMKHGDPQRAADELRRAADAADRRAKQDQDAQGLQDARQSLQNNEQQMAQAARPSDIPQGPPAQSAAPGHASQGRSGQGQQQSGQGQTTGTGSAAGQGLNGSKATGIGRTGTGGRQARASGRSGAGPYPSAGEPTSSGAPRALRGAPHPLDAKFNPTQNPEYGKIYLGVGSGASGGGKLLSAQPGAQTPGKAPASSVPYYDTLAPARRSAETAMDREDIPPAYRSGVRRYFDSLQPPAGKATK